MLRLCSLCALGLALALPVVSCGGDSAQKKKFRKYNPWAKPGTEHLLPAQLRPNHRRAGEVRTARVRVYAGHEYRAQVQNWNRRFKEQLDLANQLLVPEFGVRLEVVEFQPWTRQALNSDMRAMLTELEAKDSAADVEWVIGLVSALSSATPVMHDLGVARPLSRHILLRGHDDLALLKSWGKDLDPQIFDLRRQHKEAALLLHELAHTLGAPHVVSDGPISRQFLLFPSYNKGMKGFAPANSKLIADVLAQRLKKSKEPSQGREVAALLGYLDNEEPFAGWSTEEVAGLRKWAASQAKHQPTEGSVRTTAPTDKIPPEAGLLYKRVLGFMQQGALDQAWTELENLVSAYPAHIRFRDTACQLWLKKEGPGENARTHCTKLGQLEPTNLRGDMALFSALVQAGKLGEARSVLDTVLARTDKLENKEMRTKVWTDVLGAYRAMSAVTWTEEVLARAPADVDTAAVRAWTSTTRRRYGLPKDGTPHRITPEREGEYIAMVRQVLQLTYGKKYKEARKLARKGLRTFKNGPGFLGALCDLEYRARSYAAAHSRCSSALRYHGEASWSRYLMGILELRKKRNRSGINHLKKAIASDPDLKQAYHALFKAYARVRDELAQNELRDAYYKRFGVPIPTR